MDQLVMKSDNNSVVLFRADASIIIGSGHIMRCLTLAQHLRKIGYDCRFICRAHTGNLIELIKSKGFVVYALPVLNGFTSGKQELDHAAWLGCTQEVDAASCNEILKKLKPKWLFVDHYAIDENWERIVRDNCHNLIVIDDLADRKHLCDILIDVNLGRQFSDYQGLLSVRARLLLGPKYAILREEFADLREFSFERRKSFSLRKIMIAMGGVDLPGATLKILQSLGTLTSLPPVEIDVVMGSKAPSLSDVKLLAASMPFPTCVSVDVGDMAIRMANCDLAIGAAGGTAWERCCLGLPSLIVVLAENQWSGARALDAVGSAVLLGEAKNITERLPRLLESVRFSAQLASLSQNSRNLVDGRGVNRIVEIMESYCE